LPSRRVRRSVVGQGPHWHDRKLEHERVTAAAAFAATGTRPVATQELPLKTARDRMDIISAYREVGTFRGAAAISGTTPKTGSRPSGCCRRPVPRGTPVRRGTSAWSRRRKPCGVRRITARSTDAGRSASAEPQTAATMARGQSGRHGRL
jgi:hypothetical protein